jgi:hexosaminidase
MKALKPLTFTLATAALWLPVPSAAATVSALVARGYNVMPAPQNVTLGPGDFQFGGGWKLETGPGVDPHSIAIDALGEDLRSRFQLSFATGKLATRVVRLEMSPGSVVPGTAQDHDTAAIAKQAYRLELSPSRIRISANADTGLFYGVETFIQLLTMRNDSLWLPEGQITDWPDLQRRHIYWDDAHHLEYLPELKRAVRQAAFFKANGFVIKLEGHFQYRSAAALVEPQALSPAELQELTDYGLRYHVEVIPYLDGPGHIAFILKHPEYAKLRAFPDSNYELCITNPDSYKLMSGMFDDLLAANKGVNYFYLSTDEAYYAGMADNQQCRELTRKNELGSVGKVLAEFVTKTANYLHDRGRTVVFWGEYPLKPEDIGALPGHIVNGETYGAKFDPVYKAHGIKQMIYTSTEGEEKLFPDYFVLPGSRLLHPEREKVDRVPAAVQQIASEPARQASDLIGMFVAGWADMGLHPETFWLGYATFTAAGWNPRTPDGREAMSSFYRLFYGHSATSMDRVYQLMSYQAQVWNDTWDTIQTTARKPIWGNSEGVFNPPKPAHDQTIPLPGVPSGTLEYQSAWSRDNAQRLRAVEISVPENDELLGLLQENVRVANRNRYNLEVFLSVAKLYRQNLDMMQGLARIDGVLASMAEPVRAQRHADALAAVDRALDIARQIRTQRNAALQDAIGTWYKSWRPRVPEANGRKFLHELDDVKDHLPDRTIDMSYLVHRQLLLPLDEWYERVQTARNQYAAAHDLPARNEPLRWKSLD